MPNHCQNELYLYGEYEKVQTVLDYLKGPEGAIDFNSITKEEGSTEDESYDWYAWRHNNWGTKWNAYEVETVKDKRTTFDSINWPDSREVRIDFLTAWGPPEPIIRAVLDKFKDFGVSINFEYFEQGMGFCGGLGIYGEEDEEPIEWSSNEYRGFKGG